MSNYRLQLLAAAMCIASVPALAQVPIVDSGVSNAPITAAVSAASPSLVANPGARAAVQRNAGRSEAEGARTSDTFSGTGASIHAEDQCVIADLYVSRSDSDVGQTITYMNYNVRNLCGGDGGTISSGGMEIQDAAFSGDPRKDDAVSLIVDLTSLANVLQGPPLVINVTWTKADSIVSKARGSNSTRIRDPETGVVTKVAFKYRSVNTSAEVTGESNLFPVAGATGTIFWEDFENITAIRETAAR